MRWLLLVLVLAGCSSINPLSFLGGGGPTVNSNAQIGKENRQSVISFEKDSTAGRDIVTKEVEAGPVEQLQVNNVDNAPWLILFALLGWLLPTPQQIGQSIYSFFARLISPNPKRKDRFK